MSVFLLLAVVCRILYENSGLTQHWMMVNGFSEITYLIRSIWKKMKG